MKTDGFTAQPGFGPALLVLRDDSAVLLDVVDVLRASVEQL